MVQIREFHEACGRIAEALQPLGFAANGRPSRWQGHRDGRSWKAWFSPERRTRYAGEVRIRQTLGYRLRIDATTSVPMRAYFVKAGFASSSLTRFMYRWRRLEVMPVSAAGLERFRVVTSDAEWMARLLVQPRAAQRVAAVFEYREAAGAASSLYFEPGSLHYASPLLQATDVDGAGVSAILTGLADLAREAERLPTPARPATLNRFEVFAKAHPIVVAVIVVAGFMALSLVVVLLMLVVGWLVFG